MVHSGAGNSYNVSATTTSQPTLALTLPPVPESVRLARRALAEAGIDPDLDHTVSLLTSEVVTNAIRHAAIHGDAGIAGAFEPGYARVEVLDRGSGFDPGVRHEHDGFG